MKKKSCRYCAKPFRAAESHIDLIMKQAKPERMKFIAALKE
jgi:NACalpha-BTF3-like transcription factor